MVPGEKNRGGWLCLSSKERATTVCFSLHSYKMDLFFSGEEGRGREGRVACGSGRRKGGEHVL